jgi:SPASM domain peptide maturase of grasp-with-spasm system
MYKSHFKLYSCSVPVQGKEESIICNLHNAGYTVIPHFLCELFQDFGDLSIKELEGLYHDKDGSLLNYFNYLEEKQLGFYTDDPLAFPPLTLEWYTPERIKYGVVQIEDINRFDYAAIIRQLDELGCINIDLWFTRPFNMQALQELLELFNTTGIRSFDIYMPYTTIVNTDALRQLSTACHKVADMVLYGAPTKKKISKDRIYFTPRKLDNSKKTFKNIPVDKYIIYIEFFMESIHHNPYYNRKVCIDKNGYFRNCLTHSVEFGHVNTRQLSQVIADKQFTDLWYACNDKIMGIRDSPFRYIWLNTHELEKVDTDTYRMLN